MSQNGHDGTSHGSRQEGAKLHCTSQQYAYDRSRRGVQSLENGCPRQSHRPKTQKKRRKKHLRGPVHCSTDCGLLKGQPPWQTVWWPMLVVLKTQRTQSHAAVKSILTTRRWQGIINIFGALWGSPQCSWFPSAQKGSKNTRGVSRTSSAGRSQSLRPSASTRFAATVGKPSVVYL